MLTIVIPGDEVYDEVQNKVYTINDVCINFEHSLISLSKWESIYEKPFLGEHKIPHTGEELLEYIKCMVLTPDLPDDIFEKLDQNNVRKINEYINAKKSATWFTEKEGVRKGPARKTDEAVTSELIYYWMVAFTIPWEAQYWHLNRLINLIKICEIKNQPEKKMSKKDLLNRNRSLNEARKAQLGTTG